MVGGSICCLGLRDWDVYATYLTNLPAMPEINWHRIDITEPDSVGTLVKALKPDLMVHTAALADIDACEANPELAWRVNFNGTRNVAEAAEEIGSRLIHLSTSNVFDGRKGNYKESDETHGINAYSETKISAEQEVLQHPDALVIRTSLVLGFPKPAGRSFLAGAVKTLREERSIKLPAEEIRSPIDSLTLSRCILELGNSHHTGILHLAGIERLSRYEMGLRIARKLDCKTSLVVPANKNPTGRAPRPRDVSLDTTKARAMLKTRLPNFNEALDRAFEWGGTGCQFEI